MLCVQAASWHVRPGAGWCFHTCVQTGLFDSSLRRPVNSSTCTLTNCWDASQMRSVLQCVQFVFPACCPGCQCLCACIGPVGSARCCCRAAPSSLITCGAFYNKLNPYGVDQYIITGHVHVQHFRVTPCHRHGLVISPSIPLWKRAPSWCMYAGKGCT